MCGLTGAPRCDIYFADGDRLRLAVSIDGGELDPGRLGSSWVTAEWTPADGDPAAAPVTCLRATDKGLSRRARLAMQRRGCRSLAWAPLVLRGELVGAIELSDAGDRDFSQHADVLGGLARVCAEAVAIRRTVDELAHRDKSVRELVDLSREVAQTHDFDRFVLRFAQRLLTAANADCVDVWRVGGGVIRIGRQLHPRRRRSRACATRSSTPAAIPRWSAPSSTTRRWRSPTSATIGSAPTRSRLMRAWGFASSLTMPLVAGGELVGLVDLYDDAERDWSGDLEFLTSVCQLVAGVFDSTALLDEAREIARFREELIELGADLAAAEAPVDIAERAATRLRSVLDCSDCDIWWLEEGYLRCLASVDERGVDDERARQHPDARPLPVHQAGDRGPRDPGHQLARRRAPHRLRARGLRRVRLPQHRSRCRSSATTRWSASSTSSTCASATTTRSTGSSRRRRAPWPTPCATPTCSPGCGAATPRSVSSWSSATASTRRARSRTWPRPWRSASAPSWPPRTATSGRSTATSCAASPAWTAAAGTPTRSAPSALGEYEATVAPWPPTSRWSSATSTAPSSRSRDGAYRRWGFHSMVSLPLVVDGRPIGLIDVFDTRCGTTRSTSTSSATSGGSAGSFEKAMLVERLEREPRPALLVDSGLEFGATLDVDACCARSPSASWRCRGRPVRRLPARRRRGRDPGRHRRTGRGPDGHAVPMGLRHVPRA